MTVFRTPSRIHELTGISVPEGKVIHADKFYYFKYMDFDALKGKTYFDLVDIICKEIDTPRDYPKYDLVFDFSYPWKDQTRPVMYGRVMFHREGSVSASLFTDYAKETHSRDWLTGADIVATILAVRENRLHVISPPYIGHVPTITPANL